MVQVFPAYHFCASLDVEDSDDVMPARSSTCMTSVDSPLNRYECMHTCIIHIRIVQSHSHQLQAILSHKLAIAQRNFVVNVNHADGPQIQQDIILTSDIITDMNISAKSPQSTSALQRSRLVQARPSDWKFIEESLHERHQVRTACTSGRHHPRGLALAKLI